MVILPAPVQGEEAGAKIAAQIRRANMLGLGDVLIVGRGGGSLEDLLPFSDVEVVRAVAASEIPVISAVGHEIDTSLSDLAADLRAPTPSAAAEVVSRSREELSERISRLHEEIFSRLRSQTDRIRLLVQQFTPENLEDRFRQVMQPYQLRLDDCKEQILRSMNDTLTASRHRLELVSRTLEANSPQAILARGYAVVTDRSSGVLVSSPEQAHIGKEIDIRLQHGKIGARVDTMYDRQGPEGEVRT